MATRKIRVTMSGTQVDSQGPIVDIDFNGENLDADIDVDAVTGSSSVVKEYTVDVDAGAYDLGIAFKNDIGGEAGDRNFVIEKLEIAANGVEYESVMIYQGNSNLEENLHFLVAEMGYERVIDSNGDFVLNPDFSESETRSDVGINSGTNRYQDAVVANPKYLYNRLIGPVTLFTSGTAIININFE